ncbi:hypothetical protein [uncultured Polaribacter sp.]|uniref:hypothetical protein n=1 Tax=uncultured Polaribacter sp. TaxID=174711 RepID=UPI00261B36C8|nr:hypothetical protein [uncultured Polaribacter sp.]
MITLVNFADEKFRNKQKWNTLSAKLFGKFDHVIEYDFSDINEQSLSLNKESLKYKEKGSGNYFWKPYIVEKALNRINEGDYLMYADSGSFFLKSVLPLVKHMQKKNKEILCFRLPLIEKQWTKRDAFILMNADNVKYTETSQVLGTFFLLKKCKESINFVEKYKTLCSDSRILSDDPNELGKKNYPEFIAHRHDQSILSLLCKKHNNLLLEKDISDYGYYPYRYLLGKNRLFDKEMLNTKNNNFKGILISQRTQNLFLYLLKYYIRRILLKFNIKI